MEGVAKEEGRKTRKEEREGERRQQLRTKAFMLLDQHLSVDAAA